MVPVAYVVERRKYMVAHVVYMLRVRPVLCTRFHESFGFQNARIQQGFERVIEDAIHFSIARYQSFQNARVAQKRDNGRHDQSMERHKRIQKTEEMYMRRG